MTTLREEAEGQRQVPEDDVASRQDVGTRARARTREAVIVTLRALGERLQVLWAAVRAGLSRFWSREKTATEKAAPDPRRSSIWSQSPASVADLVVYTRSGAWAPGERAAVIEVVGKAYGYGVAVPATVALYAVAWTLQRPTRLVGVLGFLLLLRLSWGA